jgi:hypothetical protein
MTVCFPAAVAAPSTGLARTRRSLTVPATHCGRVLALWVLTMALTGVGVLVGVLLPGLAPPGTPHPTLYGTGGEAAGIFAPNARVLAAPVILAATRWGTGPITRGLADAIVIVVVLSSPLLVGAALGRHGTQLLAYLPHVPLEWAALSVAAGAWLTARHDRPPARTIAAYTALALAFAAFAAILETLAIPHAA